MILLDTVVLSELRKRDASPYVVRWLTGYRDSNLFLSVVSIGEIERGIEKKRTVIPHSLYYSLGGLRIYCVFTDRILTLGHSVLLKTCRMGKIEADQ